MSIQILTSGKFPARKLTDAIPSISSALSDKRRATLPAAYVRLLYVQTISSRRKAQLACDVIWNTEEGQAWRRQKAQELWSLNPLLQSSTPMQVLRRLWPTIRESTLIAVATQILGDDPRRAGRKVFDLKWSGFENSLRSLFFREGETYQQAMARLDAATRDASQRACVGRFDYGACLAEQGRGCAAQSMTGHSALNRLS